MRTILVACSIIIAVVSMLMIGCNDNQRQAGGDVELTKVSARIKWLAYASYAPTYVAEAEGFFAARGLKVAIYEGGPTVDATKLVAAGDNDFGICSGDQLVNARSKGLPLVAIEAEMQESPAAFAVREDSDIYSFRDFYGKKIRIIPGHNTALEYKAGMAKMGLDTSKVTEVVNASELQLWLVREVDIEPIYVNNQTARLRSLGIKFRVIKPGDVANGSIRSYGNVYFTTERMIKERPDVVRDFVAGQLDGWKATFGDPSRAVDILIKAVPANNLIKNVELDKLSHTPALVHRSDGKDGLMEKKRWQEIADWMLETGQINAPVDADRIFDNRFVEDYWK
jgi:NitT/TauT family transport system substrate-binding protein